MNVVIRKRQKHEKGNILLFLDIIDQFGNRKQVSLGKYKIFLYPSPKTDIEKQTNKRNLQLAEAVRAKYFNELQTGALNILNIDKMKSDFFKYYENKAKTKKSKGTDNSGNRSNWLSALIQLKKYHPGSLRFDQLTLRWVEGFKSYINNKALSKHGESLSESTKINYFAKLISCLKDADKEGYLRDRSVLTVNNFNEVEGEPKFLTLDELNAAAITPCKLPWLKNAFLFSCLTGLRYSDCRELKWRKVNYDSELGYYIGFKQVKTGDFVGNVISQQAYSLLGERKDDDAYVFQTPKRKSLPEALSDYQNSYLRKWTKVAGINKHITFHSGRHTYATLLINNDIDLFTVSELLGHKSNRTSKRYARILNKKKRTSVDKIKIDRIE